ncbi:hypothetical protein B484DRAFT_78374 [Ochromonadaceae sp. CCMP2298]|nr:hypothetical protein B484DRAFT_78374 [Ochromonadaceae sp. CCMP2298]
MDEERELLGWSFKQGYILTGGGELGRLSQPGRDFKPSDLPHFHLTQRTTRPAFASWLQQNRRAGAIVGAWSRPLFCGGWAESSSLDTAAFNLQTPSFFIDIRCPLARPDLRSVGSLLLCSDMQLRLLARQHCFAGRWCNPLLSLSLLSLSSLLSPLSSLLSPLSSFYTILYI